MSTFEQLQRNLAMINNLNMTEHDLKDLNLAFQIEEEGLWCHQCKACIPQCRHNLDKPSIMRSYMYAYGYRNAGQAWHTLGDAGFSGQCGQCSGCNVKCRAGFDVRKKITDIARLRSVPEDFLFLWPPKSQVMAVS